MRGGETDSRDACSGHVPRSISSCRAGGRSVPEVELRVEPCIRIEILDLGRHPQDVDAEGVRDLESGLDELGVVAPGLLEREHDGRTAVLQAQGLGRVRVELGQLGAEAVVVTELEGRLDAHLPAVLADRLQTELARAGELGRDERVQLVDPVPDGLGRAAGDGEALAGLGLQQPERVAAAQLPVEEVERRVALRDADAVRAEVHRHAVLRGNLHHDGLQASERVRSTGHETTLQNREAQGLLSLPTPKEYDVSDDLSTILCA